MTIGGICTTKNDEIKQRIDEIKYYLLKIINRYETDQSR